MVPSLDMLRDKVRLRMPDLLMVEVAGTEAEACALIQSIRQETLGNNPFVVVIVTTWRRDGTIVEQVLNSGADDLIARPISATMLGERIKGLVERRKRFVITMDYIGPDRRRESRARCAECIEVPNPLKVRCLDGVTEEQAEALIAQKAVAGKTILDQQKVRRDCVQLCLQCRMLEQKASGSREFRDILPRIQNLASGIKQRLGRAGDRATHDCCDGIAQTVASLTAVAERTARNASATDYEPLVSALGQAAMTLGRMFAPEDIQPERLMELDRIIAERAASSAAA
jgi:DNA-binding response OmpR family regulator